MPARLCVLGKAVSTGPLTFPQGGPGTQTLFLYSLKDLKETELGTVAGYDITADGKKMLVAVDKDYSIIDLPTAKLDLKPGQAFEVWAREGHVIAVPVRPLEEAFGMFPGLDTSDPRDHGERV